MSNILFIVLWFRKKYILAIISIVLYECLGVQFLKKNDKLIKNIQG